MKRLGEHFRLGARRRVFNFIVLAVSLALPLLPRTASAHAALLKMDPAPGAILTTSPKEIRLTFSEEVLPGISSLVLVQVDGTELNLRGANDSHDVHILIAALPLLPPGGYVVQWKVTSADGHPVSGSYSFVVAASPVASSTALVGAHKPSSAESLPIVGPVLRGLGMTALLALTGMLAFLTRAEGDRGPAVRPTMQWLGALALVALFLQLVVWASSVEGPSWHAVLDSGPGRLEQLRVIFALLLFISVLSASKRSLGFLFGLGALFVSATIGHPATVHPLISIPVMFVHLVAVAFWLGGVSWLIAHRAEPTVRVLIEAARVSNAAFFAAIGVIVTGVVEAMLLLTGLSDLTSTVYGALILAKIVGLLALIGFGWHHRFRSLPKLTSETSFDFTRTLRYELTVMVTVVIVAGFLAYSPTPR
jgi:copper transport protein